MQETDLDRARHVMLDVSVAYGKARTAADNARAVADRLAKSADDADMQLRCAQDEYRNELEREVERLKTVAAASA